MDTEDRLHALESRYRAALSASVAAKAHYLALLEEPGATPESRKMARQRWENITAKKLGIAALMGEIEDLV
jgi:hypothetical protein